MQKQKSFLAQSQSLSGAPALVSIVRHLEPKRGAEQKLQPNKANTQKRRQLPHASAPLPAPSASNEIQISNLAHPSVYLSLFAGHTECGAVPGQRCGTVRGADKIIGQRLPQKGDHPEEATNQNAQHSSHTGNHNETEQTTRQNLQQDICNSNDNNNNSNY